MVANAAHSGFIAGIHRQLGRLARVADGGCAPTRISQTTVIGGQPINHDTLSSFLTDGTTNVGTISAAAYAGGPVLADHLLVAALRHGPGAGSTASQRRERRLPDSRVPARPHHRPGELGHSIDAGDSDQRIDHGEGKLESVQIVFIDSEALPPMESAETTSYAGSGVREIRLVD